MSSSWFRFATLLLGAFVVFGGCRVANETTPNDPGSVAAPLPTEDPPAGPLHPLLAEVIEAGPYEPQWASLVQHPIPEWFGRDKIGISAHWGPYAAPGWTPRKDTPYGVAYAEWYHVWMRSNEAVKQYHQDTYGGVPYDEFIDGVRNRATNEIDGYLTKDFDADRWMRTFKDAGAKYFFITAKHHDGFCLWDSKYTDRNAAKMGPRRDLLRELTDAARRHGLRIGFYYSFYEWYNPLYKAEADPWGYKGIKPPADEDGDGESGEYVDDFMIPQIKELIDEFQPDYLCFDGEWEHGYPYWRGRQIAAYYFNQAAARGQEVIINDRFGGGKEGVTNTRGVYGDFYHVEYHADIDRAKPWAMWRGFGNSYGYNRNEHPDNILSIRDTLRMVVDVVADNGNVEFNLGPKADGTLAEFERERLQAMGEWLKVNGQAIYDTTRSPVGILPHGRVTHRAGTNTLYYHVYDWPANGRIDLPGVSSAITSARLLATGQELAVTRPAGDVVRIAVPETAPDPHISVIELRYVGPLKAERYVPRVEADDAGAFVLSASDATIHGATLKVEDDKNALGFWSDPDDYPEWRIDVREAGEYRVELTIACDPAAAGGTFALWFAGERLGAEAVAVPDTGSWTTFQELAVTPVALEKGVHIVAVRSLKLDGPLMNLRAITLTPAH